MVISSVTVFFLYKVVLPSKSSISETLVCDHLKERLLGGVLSCLV